MPFIARAHGSHISATPASIWRKRKKKTKNT